MKFHYTAADAQGKLFEGDLEVASSDEVLAFLASQGLKPLSLKTERIEETILKKNFFGQTIRVTDKIFLTKYLSLMLRAGTDLFRAIEVLIKDMDRPALKSLLVEIRTALEKGQPFHSTFLRYPKYFSPIFINLVKAGEVSGNLESVFANLSSDLIKEQELRNKVRSALIYPTILLTLSVLVLLLLVSFSLPKIANVFVGSGFQPPLFSRVVFAVGLFLNQYSWIIFPGLILAMIGGWLFFLKLDSNRRFISRLLYRTPIIRRVLKTMALQRFASTFSSLIRAGLPILDALEITADAVGFEDMKLGLRRIAREGIAKGLTVGEAFRREAVFPIVVTNLVAISEKAGHTEDILKTLADFYESEIDTSIKSLVAFVEPILLLVIGLMIGGIALAIIVPIYQLVGQV